MVFILLFALFRPCVRWHCLSEGPGSVSCFELPPLTVSWFRYFPAFPYACHVTRSSWNLLDGPTAGEVQAWNGGGSAVLRRRSVRNPGREVVGGGGERGETSAQARGKYERIGSDIGDSISHDGDGARGQVEKDWLGHEGRDGSLTVGSRLVDEVSFDDGFTAALAVEDSTASKSNEGFIKTDVRPSYRRGEVVEFQGRGNAGSRRGLGWFSLGSRRSSSDGLDRQRDEGLRSGRTGVVIGREVATVGSRDEASVASGKDVGWGRQQGLAEAGSPGPPEGDDGVSSVEIRRKVLMR